MEGKRTWLSWKEKDEELLRLDSRKMTSGRLDIHMSETSLFTNISHVAVNGVGYLDAYLKRRCSSACDLSLLRIPLTT